MSKEIFEMMVSEIKDRLEALKGDFNSIIYTDQYKRKISDRVKKVYELVCEDRI